MSAYEYSSQDPLLPTVLVGVKASELFHVALFTPPINITQIVDDNFNIF
jgi:hypothetical protein